MNNKTYTKMLIGLLALAVAAPVAAASDPLSDLHLEKDVAAHYKVDYSEALGAVETGKDIAGEASAIVKEKAKTKADASATATTGLGSGILAGIKENAQAFLAWAKGLYVKPSPDAAGYVSATHVQDTVADAKSLDGSIEGDVVGHLEATNVMDHNISQPPEPKLSFLGEMRAAFQGFLNWA